MCRDLFIYLFLNRPWFGSCSCVAQNKPHFLSLAEGERVERADGGTKGGRDRGTERREQRKDDVSPLGSQRGVLNLTTGAWSVSLYVGRVSLRAASRAPRVRELLKSRLAHVFLLHRNKSFQIGPTEEVKESLRYFTGSLGRH